MEISDWFFKVGREVVWGLVVAVVVDGKEGSFRVGNIFGDLEFFFESLLLEWFLESIFIFFGLRVSRYWSLKEKYDFFGNY